jgi:ABC-type multidrug transport system fused ATPase/permease subunit
MLGTPSLVFGGVFVVGALASVVRSYAIGVSQARLIARLRRRLYTALLHRPIQFYDANRSGDLVNVLSSDVNVLSAALLVASGFFQHPFWSMNVRYHSLRVYTAAATRSQTACATSYS